MSRSVLLQLARDSIAEVLQAQRTIDKHTLLEKHPLLNERIPTTVNLYIKNELRGSSQTLDNSETLLASIVKNAKRSAFEDNNFTPISTSEYLDCEVEILLTTPDGIISEKDPAIIKEMSDLGIKTT